jgi:hypothetical protein
MLCLLIIRNPIHRLPHSPLQSLHLRLEIPSLLFLIHLNRFGVREEDHELQLMCKREERCCAVKDRRGEEVRLEVCCFRDVSFWLESSLHFHHIISGEIPRDP